MFRVTVEEPMHRLTSLLIWLAVVALIAAGGAWAWQALLGSSNTGPFAQRVVVPAEYAPLIREAAARCPQIPVEIFAAQIASESSWNSEAVSSAGAQGIAQFMPGTWKGFGVDGDGDGKRSVWNPADALHSAARLNCINRKLVKGIPGNRLQNTLAAYNAGHGAVIKYQGVPPFPETENYVEKILRLAATVEFEGESPSESQEPAN